jgi:F-type H+-transporting ATPase subunit b
MAPTYDLALRWINFLLLVFLLYKYGRGPIAAFIHKKQDEIAESISRLEEKKGVLREECQTARRKLEASRSRLAEVHERILRQGEVQKASLIATAERESELLIENTRRKVAGQVIQARKQLQAEVIDAAIGIAVERLPEVIGPQDLRLQEDRFVAAISTGNMAQAAADRR